MFVLLFTRLALQGIVCYTFEVYCRAVISLPSSVTFAAYIYPKNALRSNKSLEVVGERGRLKGFSAL